ncbi:hypothetical protein, partial [Chromobacterium violaceum]|uniref:hypothetical protein n=1 Tax=Chromobacterium violaceum TaxID=536 RepID=UPI001C3E6026
MYAQFSDDGSAVVAIFPCEQDDKLFPKQKEVSPDDAMVVAYLNPAATVEGAVALALSNLAAACQSAITAGFTSSALGKPSHYGSLQTDQLNLQTMFAASQSSNPPTSYFIYCSPTPMQNPPLVQHT